MEVFGIKNDKSLDLDEVHWNIDEKHFIGLIIQIMVVM